MSRRAARVVLHASLCTLLFMPLAPSHARPCMEAPAGEVAEPPVIPETVPGKVAGAFLEMLNEGSAAAVAAFERGHGSSQRRADVGDDERHRRVGEMRERWRSFRATGVLGESERGITLAVQTGSGETLEMEFRLSGTEAGKLDGVLISSEGPGAKAMPVDRAQAAAVVEAACRALERSYVFPEVATMMTAAVRQKLESGTYDNVGDERELAQRLTDDFREVSRDKHLRVRFAPEGGAASANILPEGDALRRDNYAFRKVEILPGNIGYLRFDLFLDQDEAKHVAAGALAFLSNADALVIDLRHNGGGSPDMIRFITSYFFDTPTHLNDMYDRESKLVEEYWTLEEVPGKRFSPDVPIYVLTSSRTFSGAEEFSYNLQNLERATIVGETTGGGAHPVRGERLNERFVMGVPFMRAQNPITHTNWEGRGVEPDIKVSADGALERALEEARGKISVK